MSSALAFSPSGLISDVETKGLLVNKTDGTPLMFGFNYCGFDFSVAAQPTSDGQTEMAIVADLGSLPFTAEGPKSRRTTVKILGAAAGRMGGSLKIGADQRIRFSETVVLREALTPVALISHMVRILLAARPYLELFLSEVVAPAALRSLRPAMLAAPTAGANLSPES